MEAFQEIKDTPREKCLKPKNQEDNNRIPFVLTFHPRLRFLGKSLQKNFHILQSNNHLKQAFSCPPMAAFRKFKNIKSMLVHFVLKQGDHLIPRCEGIAM
jgi:hypothetical protein